MTVIMAWRQNHGLLIVLTIITTFCILVTGDCVFDVYQAGVNRPLLWQTVITRGLTTYQLFRSKEGKLNISSNKNLLLACPGTENYLNSTKNKWNVAECVRQSKLKINKSEIEFGQLGCKTRPKASLKIRSNRCFKNNGVVIHIGFEAINNFNPLIEVCHNLSTSQTYYVKHNVILPTTYCSKTPNKRPDFTEGDAILPNGPEMRSYYSDQYITLQRLIGSNAINYINPPGIRFKNKYLARGHLAPDADFPIDAWQTLTYFYINAAPQWQSINVGNWLSLERKVRSISTTVKQLNVITGTYGILEIERKKFYLGNKRVPVPEYFWKLLHNDAMISKNIVNSTDHNADINYKSLLVDNSSDFSNLISDNSCMGFVTKNDPYLDPQRMPEPICRDVCSTYKWNFRNANPAQGYIYCCEYSDLRRVVKEVPSVTCSRPLNFQVHI